MLPCIIFSLIHALFPSYFFHHHKKILYVHIVQNSVQTIKKKTLQLFLQIDDCQEYSFNSFSHFSLQISVIKITILRWMISLTHSFHWISLFCQVQFVYITSFSFVVCGSQFYHLKEPLCLSLM
jgi:hypothetical protein